MITQEKLTIASSLFILMSGILVFVGSVIVYLDKKTRLKKNNNKK